MNDNNETPKIEATLEGPGPVAGTLVIELAIPIELAVTCSCPDRLINVMVSDDELIHARDAIADAVCLVLQKKGARSAYQRELMAALAAARSGEYPAGSVPQE